MPRTIINKIFEVRFECDRCKRQESRDTDGDISIPLGWQFLVLTTYNPQREGPLLCPSCVTIVLTAAAPAQLQLKPTFKT
jgi:hypothetical protein